MDTLSCERVVKQHDRFQRAVTEISISEFCSGTVVYVDKGARAGGWLAMFPDGIYRCVGRDDLRLCW